MKSQKSSGKPKRRKLLVVRRVRGRSMMPYLDPNQVVFGYGKFKDLQYGDIVIFWHGDMEKIKRVHDVTEKGVFVVGDNASESTDSRHFGHVPHDQVIAKLIY